MWSGRTWVVFALVVVALVVCALAGCGRIGFDPVGGGDDVPAGVDRIDLTVAGRGEALADFPLLVVLDATRANLAKMAADASDLRFYDASGVLLAHEIEQARPAVIAWVRADLATTPTTLRAQYGDPDAPRLLEGPWSDVHEAVWHFADAAQDSSAHAHHGTIAGTQPTAGRIGPGRAFDRSAHDSIAIPDSPRFVFGDLTMSGWVRFTDFVPGDFQALFARQFMGGQEDDLFLTVYGDVGNSTAYTSVGGGEALYGTTHMASGTWHHIESTVRANGGELTLYIDGGLDKSVALAGTLANTRTTIFMGSGCNSGFCPDVDFLDGALDELRLELILRTPEWIRTEFLSQTDQLITYGPIQ